MKYEIDLALKPQQAADDIAVKVAAAVKLGVDVNHLSAVRILKRSIDARSRNIIVNIKLEIYVGEQPALTSYKVPVYKSVSTKPSVIIVGAGPAGLFAALRLIELGLKPIVIERGKDVRSRRRDLAKINREQIVDPNSNYCFGEGGAGTYSDGKLYTRSTKRGDVMQVLELFVQHGADPNILIEAHPHIGTNKLPNIIVSMREAILNAGGEVQFQTSFKDLILKNNCVKGVVVEKLDTAETSEIIADAVVLATGHSARDVFELLNKRSVLIEAKPFALGVRIEHPQELIDSIQYHCKPNEVKEQRNYLPAASYNLVQQVDGKGVYSFCMCPGGIIAPCATAPGEIVTNGWSPSKRDNPFANSGIVVSIEEHDWLAYKADSALAALRYQQAAEVAAFKAGGGLQIAPAQRMVDFVNGKISATLPNSSYQPGTNSVDLMQVLPQAVGYRLQQAFKAFKDKMRGYYTNDAVIHGVESRTSSPVRIPRDRETLEHVSVKGLYPCGEGAGYAGGIVSAAIDGQAVAQAIATKLA